jgi:drug/metabolite transporter (DMT)-like permease
MGTEPPTHSKTKLLLAFAAIYILWGSTYLAMRLAIETVPPFLMASTRFLVAGSLLYAFSSRSAPSRPTPRQWRNAAVASVALFVVGNGGVAWAQQVVPTGASALVVATLPAWLLLLDWGYGGRGGPKLVEVLGIGLGLAGVAALSAPGGIHLVGAGVLLVSAIGWAVGSLFARHADFPDSPVRTSAMQMLVGGVFMASVGLALGEGARFDPAALSLKSALSLAYLIAVALVALPAYNWLLTVTSPAIVGTYAFVNPVVAVILGWAAVGEALTGRTAVAALLVVSGVMLLVWPRKRAQLEATEESKQAVAAGTGHPGE